MVWLPSKTTPDNILDPVNIFSVKDIKTVEQEVKSLVAIFYNIENKLTRKGVI